VDAREDGILKMQGIIMILGIALFWLWRVTKEPFLFWLWRVTKEPFVLVMEGYKGTLLALMKPQSVFHDLQNCNIVRYKRSVHGFTKYARYYDQYL
jgi:hypothetical protein